MMTMDDGVAVIVDCAGEDKKDGNIGLKLESR